MVIQVLVVLSELDLFDRDGTFGSLLIIPVCYWPLFPAKWEVKVYWPIYYSFLQTLRFHTRVISKINDEKFVWVYLNNL